MSAEIRFSVLGAVRVYRGETVLPTRSPQQQALLAALLLRSGRAASAHDLIAAIWGVDAPDSALASLRTYAWRLRQTMEEDRAAPKILVSLRDGYQLLVPPLSVDVHLAEQLAADAGRARAAGQDDECGRLLTEAVNLWQGEPLAGVPGPFAEQQRSRLTEMRLGLLEERFEHDLRRGRHVYVIPDLTAFTQEYPLQERPYGFLMRALYASGRQADALAVFTRARHVLAEELGVDPGPELTTLHERVLAGDPLLSVPTQPRDTGSARPSAASELEPAAPAAPPAAPRPAQLPADTADFTGRASAVERLCEALTSPGRTSLPVASVTGMGGIGKTTLALRVAHQAKQEFSDGQLYADLRGNGLDPADPGTVLGSLLTALGVQGHALPTMTEDRARLFRSMLDGRRILLLLDNARDPAQVRPLLPGSADCAVIITSRARLVGLTTSVRADLDVFATDEAIALLTAIVGEARVAEEPEAAVELVTACGHLPLAVRIVAARLSARPQWRVETMTGRLADERRRIGELRAGDLAVAAAFELGYHQLTEEQARAFRLLAPVTQPSIGLVAAAAALDLSEDDAEDLLESLVDAAMLEAPMPGRYRYHNLVRAFALQLGGDVAAGTRALGRFLDFLLAGGCSAFQHMVPGDPAGAFLTVSPVPGPRLIDLADARAWVTAEFDCVANAVMLAARTPMAGDSRMLRAATDLLIALSPFGKDIPYGQLAAAARTVAEAAALRGDDHAEGRARFVCGNAALQNTRLAEAETQSRLAAQASQRAGDTVILRQTLNDRGLIAQFQHRHEDAVRYYDQAIVLARELGQRSGELATMLNAAQARLRSGRAEEALKVCEEALAALREITSQHGIAYALYVQGLALHQLDRHAEALTSYRQCLNICAAANIRGQEAQARIRLAETLRVIGEADEALEQAGLALVLCEELGAERDQGYSLLALGRALSDLGRHEAALGRARQSYAVFTRLGLPDAAQAKELMAVLEPAEETEAG
ncbi:DNA-binding SARP family transcriptional activator/tetratricopeptide (TPR) repeat protein [Kitasatospora sp. MAA4]|uniref:AfsR/SARP family transcriptional regulator n=1 Tax=Kitasatospora sp. MAA4 TaxID=3035093 RepID=UPI002475737A|nr:BTAD domain-containing putative transcriptional regulator [Kitasatospora sp. MAA4]MDH6136275.1 DNA-binding SARP family transcriptional activator/tetratricopeptide (TPR) repeat protein [Kitasatospora sp. MAA4]